MNYKTYRKFLYALLLVILGMLGSVYVSYKETDNYSSAITLSDVKGAIQYAEEESVTARTDENGQRMVIPCGDPIGIYVKSEGVMVIAPGEVTDSSGNTSSPCGSILQAGDYIMRIDDTEINDKKTLIETVRESDGKKLKLSIKRDGKDMTVYANPVKTEKGYMLGLWVKDDISGIGTLTYIDEKGFGALGHSINDNDTGKLFKVSDGALYKAKIINVVKPKEGKPGKIEGVIDYSKKNIVGRIIGNTECGVYGYLTKYGRSELNTDEWMPVAEKDDISLGDAYILSSISGKREYYKAEITDIDLGNQNYKHLEIKITDERILNDTGGIVQGLSGTPIIQNGKIIGAVTHVFVENAKKGYGIYIGAMME